MLEIHKEKNKDTLKKGTLFSFLKRKVKLTMNLADVTVVHLKKELL